LLQKERKERMALMPDKNFDLKVIFLKCKKITTELPTLQVRFSTDSIPGAI
jgi:hypothetical protein